jgi:hypothetical protein
MASSPQDRYPPAIADLLTLMPLAPLGPGTPVLEARARLEAVRSVFPPGADRDATGACLSGLWLAFNFLEESHGLSQDLHTAEGSYWHAIMHRREPDAGNSNYWFRKVGSHPVISQLTEQAPSLGYNYMNPQEFITFCERVRGTGSADEELAKKVQRLEWDLLFAHCYRAAI